jgi:hypothetical protein
MAVNVVVKVRCQISRQVAGHAVKFLQRFPKRWRLGFHGLDSHNRARGPVNIRRQHDLPTFDCRCDAHAVFFAWNLRESKTHSVPKSGAKVATDNHDSNPMKQMPDRSWLLMVELKHGHHRYAFLVDGVLTLDPRAQGITRNDKGERVCLVPVS